MAGQRLNGSLLPLPTLTGQLSSPQLQVVGHMSNTFVQGLSAYEVATANGFSGTEEEWLESLVGDTITLRNNDGILEWKYTQEDDNSWHELYDLKTELSETYISKEDFAILEDRDIDDILDALKGGV